VITRRTLLQVGGSLGLSLVPAVGCARDRKEPSPTGSGDRARVVIVRSTQVMGKDHTIDSGRLWVMVEHGLRRLTDRPAAAALNSWIRGVDTVGLKVNCLAGRQMSTHLELVQALVGIAARAGLARKQFVVFDRSDLDLRHGGYPIRLSGADFRCVGNDRVGYEPDLRVMRSGASRFSRVATETAQVLINLPVLKDHGIAGVSGALKNNFGLVHNPNKFHLNGCDPHVAEVNAQEFVRRKQRLVICDALRVQVEGGPAFHPAGAVDQGAILLATDPVALDVVAWDLLERLRKQRGLPSLERDRRKPVHILGAARAGLGVADRTRIQVIEVKV